MSRIISARCMAMFFDNKAGKLYYPGDQDDIDLDDPELALCFDIPVKERPRCIAEKERIAAAREKENKAAKKTGLNVIQYRKYLADMASVEAEETGQKRAEA